MFVTPTADTRERAYDVRAVGGKAASGRTPAERRNNA
jgi:hypothetical protein